MATFNNTKKNNASILLADGASQISAQQNSVKYRDLLHWRHDESGGEYLFMQCFILIWQDDNH